MELLTTTSFYTDLLKIPHQDQKKFTRAVKLLQADPFVGGGKAKKCFKHKFNNVYRYRIGGHRIIYCVGKKCIKLLTVGKRDDIYERFEADPDLDIGDESGAVAVDPIPIATTHYDPPKIVDPLPGEDSAVPDSEVGAYPDPSASNQLISDLLEQWGIPDSDRKAIAGCSNIEEILDLDIDDEVKEVVLRWNNPPKIEEVIEEPVYELPSAEVLDKYLDGTLKGFLLKLDPEQEKVARKNLKGPTLVKGGPGTGKSLVALYRIRNLMRQEAQKGLFGEKPPKVLFVTYTTTLIKASQQLLKPLLGDSMKHVTVNNLDKIVRRIVGQAGYEFNPAYENHKTQALKDAIEQIRNESTDDDRFEKLIRRASVDYLIAEFDWVIEGREITDLESYLTEERTGRGMPFDKETRKAAWRLHQRYLKNLEKLERSTWDQLRACALNAIINGEVDHTRYDVVIVDEAQDLTPVGLRLCVALCKDPKGLYMTADMGQSIYNRGFSWKRVDEAINVRGRTTILKYNYRSTRQIMEAALQPLRDNGGGDPETTDLIPVLDGPKPRLIACDGMEGQVAQAVKFLKRSAEELRLPVTAGAVLVRGNKAGTEFAEVLTAKGIPADLVRGETFDFDRKVVKVMTIHSAKGLEFPFTAVVRVDSNQIPIAWNINDPDEKQARYEDERRLLSVALSRAMRRLIVLYDKAKPSRFIREFDRSLWN